MINDVREEWATSNGDMSRKEAKLAEGIQKSLHRKAFLKNLRHGEDIREAIPSR